MIHEKLRLDYFCDEEGKVSYFYNRVDWRRQYGSLIQVIAAYQTISATKPASHFRLP